MKNILIIEDDRKIAMALTLRIKSAGYEATTAYDTLSGVKCRNQESPGPGAIGHLPAVGNGFTAGRRNPNSRPDAHSHHFYYRQQAARLPSEGERTGAAGYFEKPYEAKSFSPRFRTLSTRPYH